MSEHDDSLANRRSSPRIPAQILVRVRSLEELVTTYTSDLSQGGVYVTGAPRLAVGDEADVSLELPDGLPPALLRARVAYVLRDPEARAAGKVPGMGMQFIDADTSALSQRIADCLASTVEAEGSTDELSLRVLVVEDSSAYRAEIVGALREAGHRVSTADDGLAGLGKAVKELPDVVLSDVNMPTMDGWQMLRILRSRPATRRIPVIFLTTLGTERDRLRGYEAGVDDYLAKPFGRGELITRVLQTHARVKAREEAPKGAGTTALSGDLKLVSLPSVLAFAEAERRTGVLVVRGSRGELRVAISSGHVVRVDLPAGSAPPATLFERLMVALDTKDGRFELSTLPVPEGDEVVSVQGALLEHARRSDERGR